MENIQQNSTKEKIKLDFKDANYATGKRKNSIARVWLKKGSGQILINGKKTFKIYNVAFNGEHLDIWSFSLYLH